MKKKGGGGEEGGSWMDTYGDLVTLLLTFFVLLYSMSSIDSAKWDLFVKSIYPNGRPGDKSAEQVILNGAVSDSDGEGAPSGLGDPNAVTNQPADVGQLYIQLASALNQAGADGVSVSEGEDYTYIVFKDKTFFDGDSSAITEQGQQVLSIFCDAIAPDRDSISQINIMGHTAQADPTHPNNIRNDRMLASMRAAEVCIFIQSRDVIEPEKLVSIGYGQWRPVGDNATSAGRAKNRRVEILIIDKDAEVRNLNEYYQEYYSGKNDTITTTGDGNAIDQSNLHQYLTKGTGSQDGSGDGPDQITNADGSSTPVISSGYGREAVSTVIGDSSQAAADEQAAAAGNGTETGNSGVPDPGIGADNSGTNDAGAAPSAGTAGIGSSQNSTGSPGTGGNQTAGNEN